MKQEKWLLTISGAWLISTSLGLATWYNEGVQITEHNDNARKQILLPLVREFLQKEEDLTVSAIDSEKNCQRTNYSEPVNVFLEQKLIGRYCLNRSIDEKIKRTWEEETPLAYTYHSARELY